MALLLTIIFGAVVGWVASMIMHSSHGILMDVVLGIVGAIVGNFVASLLGISGTTGFNLYSFLIAVVGAVLVIAIGRALTRGTSYA